MRDAERERGHNVKKGSGKKYLLHEYSGQFLTADSSQGNESSYLELI